MDVVSGIARRLDARGFAGEPRLHQPSGKARLPVSTEAVRHEEFLKAESFAIGIRRLWSRSVL
jgi:hypothetical protein